MEHIEYASFNLNPAKNDKDHQFESVISDL